MDNLLDTLTPAQREAVEHIEGPLLILAGPGSGKTRVITHRVANMLRQGIRGNQILALTFTNKAAEEMQSRVERLAPGVEVMMCTFHRFCAKLLRHYAPQVGLEPNYSIYDMSDSKQVLKHSIEEVELDSDHFTPDRIAHVISHAKNHLITPDKFVPMQGDPLESIVADIYPVYQRRLLQSNAVDFDDLLMHIATLLRENPEIRSTLDARYKYIMVDEYQDTNLAQYAIARALSIDYDNLCATGDPDQSIYGWRGANLNNILEFERNFPDVHVVRLEQNYRSTKKILRAAQHLISHNRMRKPKDLFTENEEGCPVRLKAFVDQRAEAEGLADRIAEEVRAGRRRPRDFAVFFRTNALSRSLEEGFRVHGVPYQLVRGVEFYQRKEIKDALAYLQLLNNPRDDVSLLRIINTPARGISKRTLERLQTFSHQRNIPLLESARHAEMIDGLPRGAPKAVLEFMMLFDRLQKFLTSPVEEIVGRVLQESGYQEWLEKSEDPADAERRENLEELLSAARQFDETQPGGTLEEYLEQARLTSDTDEWEAGDDRVTLMTLHASKGLEFPVVFIVAVEEQLLPHEFNREDPAKLEEERRLMFVGMTRAQQELTLTYVQRRHFRGRLYMPVASQFLMQLPRDEMDLDVPSYTPFEDEQLAFGSDFDHPAEEWETAYLHDTPADSEEQSNTSKVDNSANRFAGLKLTTAAAMSGKGETGGGQVPAEVFHQGMVVTHPEYGIGKIVALSGAGAMRRATVAFAMGAGERKFILAQCPLRPVKKSGT